MTTRTIQRQHMDSWIAQSVEQIGLSSIKEMAMLSAAIEDAASLAWGLPSFQTPEYIRKSVIEALDNDEDLGKYALPDGLKALRQLAADKHRHDTGVHVDPDDNVLISAGNMQGLHTLFHVIINLGDEIILTDPGFASHIQQIRLNGGQPVFWSLDEENNWDLDIDALPHLMTEKTKAIVLVSPSNPTGKIFSEQQLLQVAKIATAHNVFIIIDDPYSHFVYDNRDKYFNLATVESLRDQMAYLYTFSKAYAMSGWRLAYMILPTHMKKHAIKVHDATMICTPRISQVAGIAALSQPSDHIQAFESTFARRRELICQRLDNVPHVFQYKKPDGAYYVFPKIAVDHPNAKQFAMQLLQDAKVTVTPGSAFGPGGEHHVRMAYCVSDDTINKAFDRIENYFGR